MEGQMTETRDTKLETRQKRDTRAGYMRLDAWKLSDDLALQLFNLTNGLSTHQRWLRSQIMRAAVPANIAEGYSRSSNKELLQFLSIARGSLAEVEYYLHFLTRAQLIDQAAHDKLHDLARRAGQTLFGLMKSVRADLPEKRTNKRYLREETDGYDVEPE